MGSRADVIGEGRSYPRGHIVRAKEEAVKAQIQHISRRVACLVALAGAAIALAAPSALAMTGGSVGDTGALPAPSAASAGGLDWSSAGIGAAAVAGLVLLALAAATYLRHRRGELRPA